MTTLPAEARIGGEIPFPHYEPTYRFTVASYHMMIDAGVFTDDDAVELLQGWIVASMPKKPAHRTATVLLRQFLESLPLANYYVDSQEPLTLTDSEPEPDVSIVRGSVRDYSRRHPGGSDVVLVVEVSDATLQRDQRIKKQIYAAAGIAQYWIVNLIDRQIELYFEPSGPGEKPDYLQVRTFLEADLLPVAIDGHDFGSVAVQQLLP